MRFKFARFLKPAFFNDKKYTCIKAARRTGKTMNACIWLIIKLMQEKKAGLWVDTTQANLANYVDRYFKPILGDVWKDCRHQRQDHQLHFPNGSYIDMRSAERPELMEGFEYDYVVLNEAGIILKKPNIWHNSIMPMCKNASVKIVGTPKGKNTFHSLYSSNEESWASYSFNGYESPFWESGQLDAIRHQVPLEVWQQEYLAEFLDGAGVVFRNIKGCTIPRSEYVKQNITYCMGVDLAKHQDFTVIYVAEQQSKKIVYQERFNQIDWTFQKQRIYNTYQAFGRPKMIIDATGVGDPIYDDLRNNGVSNIEPFKFTSSSKADLIRGLSVSMDNEEIKFMAFPELINELEVFGYEVSSTGNIRYNAPDGLHDDCVIALALVNKLLNHGEGAPQIWII